MIDSSLTMYELTALLVCSWRSCDWPSWLSH